MVVPARCIPVRYAPRMRSGRLNPLIEETISATIAMTALGAIIAALFWLFTGLSPWPYVILGEIAGFGFGIAVLALTSPRRDR